MKLPGWEKVEIDGLTGLILTFSMDLGVTADYGIKNTSDILLGYNVPYGKPVLQVFEMAKYWPTRQSEVQGDTR
ncbi:hypothetical protein NXX18_20585 [Bacteroides fragilis]|nr:hypothetical protein [Bacteroides fragilis]